MKIICIGDSLTQGFGVLPSENWVEILNEKREANFSNKGISGDTSGGMLSRFRKDVIDEKPQYVIIMGGVNDFIAECSLGVVQANIMAMVHQAYHYKIIPIIGIGLKIDAENFRQDWVELTDIDLLNSKISKYRNWIMKFCEVFNISSIDFYSEFDHKIQGEYGSYLLDGLHPSKEGHEIMAHIAYKCIFT